MCGSDNMYRICIGYLSLENLVLSVFVLSTETHVNVSEELLRMGCAKRSMNCKVEMHVKNNETSVMSSSSSGYVRFSNAV